MKTKKITIKTKSINEKRLRKNDEDLQGSFKKKEEQTLEIRDPTELHKLGNRCYRENNFNSAIDYYTKAIKYSENDSVLFSNRARCYFMLKNYNDAVKDAKVAIDKDPKNIKAYLLYSRSLANRSKLDINLDNARIALKCCNSALEICEAISQTQFKAPCKKLIKKLRILVFLKEIESYNYQVARLKNYYKEVVMNSTRVSELLNKFLVEKKKKSIPDAICCPITLEIFKKPVITQYGNTYECKSLINHFSNSGCTDPIVRAPVNPHALVINNAMVGAKKWFYLIQPWSKITESDITSVDLVF